MLSFLNLVAKGSKVALVVCGLLYAASRYRTAGLPPGSDLVPELKVSPIQGGTDESDFTFSYRGTDYLVQPQASYTLSGLIVSHNNIHSFDDIYHDANSVDLKDICVVWGTNAFTGIYRQMQFWSEPWSCNYRFDRESGAVFDPNQLSNNHLLSDDPEIQTAIRGLRKGDQVRLSGLLVNYRPSLYPDHLRKSSLIRTDTGNGACEVLFVDEIKVLRRYAESWWAVRELTYWLLLASAAAYLVAFFCVPYLELRRTIERNNAAQ